VAVSQNEAVAGDDHPRAHSALPSTPIGAFDADNCWPDTVGHSDNRTRIGIEQCLVRRAAGWVFVKAAAGGVKQRTILKD
jgi:hypothetical protein